MSLADQIVAALKEKRVLGECRCGIKLGDACGRDRVGSLDVSVTVVDAYDQKVIVMLHLKLLCIYLIFGSEIWSLSLEPKTIIYLFRGLRVARMLHECCKNR